MNAKDEHPAQYAHAIAPYGLQEYARLSRRRFDEGVTGYIEVLIAQNELFGAELARAQTQADTLTQIVNVYKAMGGGWVFEAEKLTPPPAVARPLARRLCSQERISYDSQRSDMLSIAMQPSDSRRRIRRRAAPTPTARL